MASASGLCFVLGVLLIANCIETEAGVREARSPQFGGGGFGGGGFGGGGFSQASAQAQAGRPQFPAQVQPYGGFGGPRPYNGGGFGQGGQRPGFGGGLGRGGGSVSISKSISISRGGGAGGAAQSSASSGAFGK